MNILIVGGAGKVGSIIRPALEPHYTCYYYDRLAVEGAGDRSIIGDLNDDAALARAVKGMDVIVNLAMGVLVKPDGTKTVFDIDTAFSVNISGAYRLVHAATQAGVRRFVYASTLSVYASAGQKRERFDETRPPNATDTYGMTKQLGELIHYGLSQQYPQAGVVVLRLIGPSTTAEYAETGYRQGATWQLLGPEDTGKLFVAAVERTAQPGIEIVQATGDLDEVWYPNARAAAAPGWKPVGK